MALITDRTRKIIAVSCLILSLAIHLAFGVRAMQSPKILFGDGIEYLNTAYHLHQANVFSDSGDGGSVPPAIGREPMYPLLLAGLMRIDTGLASYRPACADPEGGCDAARFRGLSLVNLLLIELTAVLTFVLARRVTGDDAAASVASGYLLLNVNLLRSHWFDPMSDELALALVAAAMLTAELAWGRNAPLRWMAAGLTLAALSLTKAIFVPFSLGYAALAFVRWVFGRPTAAVQRRMPLIAITVYALVVGGWMVRNWEVSGMFRLTDDRGGIALSTREVFDHMTPAQVAAAFVYWSPGGGSALAKRLFSPDTVAPFDLYAAGGFYDRGQNGYGRRVDAFMRSDGLQRWQARSAVDHAIMGEILRAPWGYLTSLPPLIYRGLWFDQFAFVSLPVMVWVMGRCRNAPAIFLLSFGLFNELAYALFSLNIPRYQITAMPALALASAMATTIVARWVGTSRFAGRHPQVAREASS